MAVDFQNTKFSDIDLDFVKQYLRIESDFIEDDTELTLIIETAKAFVVKHSAMTLAELDADKTANVVYLKLISDLYQNRSATSEKGLSVDPIFKMMLGNLKSYENYFGTPETEETQ